MNENPQSRFATHIFRAGAYIAGFFWLALTYVGGVLVSRRETEPHSHLAGWAVLVVIGAVMIATMNHWVKYLPVILGGGILVGLLATGTGHLLNSNPFPRPIAAGVTALFGGCSLLSRTLARRKLTMFDRAALIAFLVAFVSGIVKNTPTSGLIGLGIGLGCLLAAWLRDRLSSSSSRAPREATQHRL